MQTVYTEAHKKHAPRSEFLRGELVSPFETPSRAEQVIDAVRSSDLGAIREARGTDLTPIQRVHAPELTDFLQSAWRDWVAAGLTGEASPWIMPPRDRVTRRPTAVDARMGQFAFTADTTITEGTWEAVRAAAAVALTAQSLVADGEPGAFALCRPPGHHAAGDLYGGYCFLNNAAIAAQAFLDEGASRVAILDIDFHHGNGTQSIFYDRADVLFLSIHGDPRTAFPYYWGYADETGERTGEGWTGNYPLPSGTGYDAWSEALDHACRRIEDSAPEVLVVSLGVDAYKGDPISFFTLESEDFQRCGARIGRLRLPTVFVMEGGYAVAEIGINTVNVLTGFEDA